MDDLAEFDTLADCLNSLTPEEREEAIAELLQDLTMPY